MSRLLSRLLAALADFKARSTRSCRRSLTRWKLLRLRLLQRRELRLIHRLERNQQRQVHLLQSQLLTEHRQRQLESLQLERPQFDLRRLL